MAVFPPLLNTNQIFLKDLPKYFAQLAEGASYLTWKRKDSEPLFLCDEVRVISLP